MNASCLNCGDKTTDDIFCRACKEGFDPCDLADTYKEEIEEAKKK